MKLTYRGIQYKSNSNSCNEHHEGNCVSLRKKSEPLLNRKRLDFLIWRGVSYSKNFHL